MADLPARPSLDHLRRQARDLLRAAQAGDTTAAGRIRAVSDALTLASAQLAVARGYGFASWPRLKDEVAARTASLARQAEAFCEASIGDGTGRAARMLAATPELARHSFATAVVLGDAGRVRTELGRDPGLATRTDPRTRYADDADPLAPVIYAAIRSGCSAGLTGLLLGYGAGPHIPGPDGRSPYVLAVSQGRTGLAMLLRQHGADVTVTGASPAAGRLPGRGPGQGRAAAGRRPRAARSHPRRAAGRGDDPRRRERQHRGHHAAARPRLPR